MRKLFLITMLLLVGFGVYAQVDSTQSSLITGITNVIEGKYAWVTGVLAFLWILSEALAQIPAIKANSVFQAIANILGIAEKKP